MRGGNGFSERAGETESGRDRLKRETGNALDGLRARQRSMVVVEIQRGVAERWAWLT